MSESILQILLILSYLAIGLVSVTFPIYAISVNYLPQEKWESEKERKKRIEELRKKISQLSSGLGDEHDIEKVARLREQIAKYESELKGTELKYQYLTAKGAVGIPVIALVLAMLLSLGGIYFFYERYQEGAEVCGFFSVVFSAVALYRLYKTISAVEYSALRTARTVEFIINYVSGKESEKIKIGKEEIITVCAGTTDVHLECFEINFFIPPEIEVKEYLTSDAYGFTQGPKTNHPFHTMVTREKAFVSKNTSICAKISISAKKIGKYVIPVEVSAKGIYSIKGELSLLVVE